MTDGEKIDWLHLASLWREKAGRIRDTWECEQGNVAASAIETCAEEVEDKVKEMAK